MSNFDLVLKNCLLVNEDEQTPVDIGIKNDRIEKIASEITEEAKETLDLEPFQDKWISFGWKVLNVNGHSHEELVNAFHKAKNSSKPTCIIANTIKGKGVSFMENSVLWHYRSPQGEEYEKALKELEDA